ncbi:MAG: MBL fold metallo-hydrolase [Bacillales bacterium]|nr:MBL fold metallo-hydrolase [Bacillales bacterium]
MKIKWLGTASLLISSENSAFLIDPFIPERGSKVKTKVEDYDGVKNILITHAHYDHLSSIPLLLSRSDRMIYGTNASYLALQRKNISPNNFKTILMDESFYLEDFKISVFKSKHIKYDIPTLMYSFCPFRLIRYCYNLKRYLIGNKLFKEENETIAFLIEYDNKKIMVFGSLGYDKNIVYPSEVDLLVLPYQGRHDLITPALDLIEKIKPKKILLDHFDNTFPPLSKTKNTSKIQNLLKGKIEVIKINQGEYIEI